jgi:ABC-type phosphate/phosphonate transport system substrate-binding protein
MQILLQPFKTLMEDQTGVQSVLVNGGDQNHLGQEIMEDRVQLGVFHGFEFSWARLKYPELKPLLIAVNQESYCRSLLVVRQDNPAVGIGELKGKVLTMPRLSCEHCRLYLERRCTPPGVPLEKHYSQVLTAGNVEEALDLVVDGKAAATLVDLMEFRCYMRSKPGRAAQLRKLLESEPFPCAVVAYNPTVLPKKLVTRFREGMIAAQETTKGQQMLMLCRITGFESVPAGYEQMLGHIAKAYPPREIKSTKRARSEDKGSASHTSPSEFELLSEECTGSHPVHGHQRGLGR